MENIWLTAMPVSREEFDHLDVRFVSVQDQVDTERPIGRAICTIIGAWPS